jgi:DNA repair protein RecO (recombination protein O)
MGLNKDEAIILSTRPFGESDKIVKLFTLTSGKLTGIAKGAKKSQKRFMNTLEPFNHINMEYFEKPSAMMVRIENADLRESNSGLEVSLKRVCLASFFSEFTERLTKEKEKNQKLFYLLRNILVGLKHVEFRAADILYYELQMLSHLGYMPNFASCVYCGKNLGEHEKIHFSRERGGVLCHQCSRSIPHRTYPQGLIPRLGSLDGRDRVVNDEVLEHRGRELLEEFISFHLDVEFKSYRLLRSITG